MILMGRKFRQFEVEWRERDDGSSGLSGCLCYSLRSQVPILQQHPEALSTHVNWCFKGSLFLGDFPAVLQRSYRYTYEIFKSIHIMNSKHGSVHQEKASSIDWVKRQHLAALRIVFWTRSFLAKISGSDVLLSQPGFPIVLRRPSFSARLPSADPFSSQLSRDCALLLPLRPMTKMGPWSMVNSLFRHHWPTSMPLISFIRIRCEFKFEFRTMMEWFLFSQRSLSMEFGTSYMSRHTVCIIVVPTFMRDWDSLLAASSRIHRRRPYRTNFIPVSDRNLLCVSTAIWIWLIACGTSRLGTQWPNLSSFVAVKSLLISRLFFVTHK